MTATSCGTGKYVIEYDNHRYEDWLRKRRLRLEQVRKQSNALAKVLREKTLMEKKSSEEEYVKVKKVELDYWKATMLEELERKYSRAVKDFGRAHELAADENNLANILEVKNKINQLKAIERGEAAIQEEEKRRKSEIEKKLAPISRKKNTRKVEDLRSALVCSVQKNLMHAKALRNKEPQNYLNDNFYENEKKVGLRKRELSRSIGDEEEKDFTTIPAKQVLKKRMSTTEKRRKEKKMGSSLKDKQKFDVQNYKEQSWEEEEDVFKDAEDGIPLTRDTVWINLNELKSSSGRDTESKNSSSSKTKQSSKSSSGKREPIVTFYDQVSRCYTKSFREYPNLVEKVDYKTEPHGFELARIEEEEELEEIKKKESADKMRQERGKEALYKEKIKREYNKLLSKLGELSSKEKLLKTEQRIPPGILHMNDERIKEKTKTRQKYMESKFEKIFYDSTFKCPYAESQGSPKLVYYQYEAGDISEQPPTYLSFSPSNLKTNSPASQESPREKKSRKKRKIKKKNKKKLLSEIEKVLEKGRELRRSASEQQSLDSSEWDKTPQEEVLSFSDNESSSGEYSQSESQKIQPVVTVKCKMKGKSETTVQSQDREAQTDVIKTKEECEGVELGALEIDTKLENESLPVSTSTSYKSPPSVIHSCKLHQFLAYLEGVSDLEEHHLKESSPRFRKRVKHVLKGMILKKAGEIKEQVPARNPTLEYYILKLLSMSREHIADLSVSSDNQSTTTLSDLETKNEDLDEISKAETKNSVKSEPKGEDLIREMRLKRAADWEEKINLWKAILEKNIKEPCHPSSEGEDGHVYSNPPAVSIPDDKNLKPDVEENNKKVTEEVKNQLPENEEKFRSPEEKSKYEVISQKCSERILELSNLLNKVRMDKEKLLSSTSGSNLSIKNSEKEFIRDEDVCFKKVEPFAFNDFPYSCKTKSLEENVSNKAVADSNSPLNSTMSSEPLPDVENELLKREIISSPFRWGDGNHTIDLVSINHNLNRKPSIESVIGNFRKEMSKIKPFSLVSADNYLVSEAQNWQNSDYFLQKGNRKLSSEFQYTEESSVDSINNALTSLGLNWAKSFLKKNEESRAISSSSYSEESKSSEDEEK